MFPLLFQDKFRSSQYSQCQVTNSRCLSPFPPDLRGRGENELSDARRSITILQTPSYELCCQVHESRLAPAPVATSSERDGKRLLDAEPETRDSTNGGVTSESPGPATSENHPGIATQMTGDEKETGGLTVIARHKKRGEESLNKFKEEVRKFAVDHTFKETAKKYGIHHSTVSGWVKESEKADKCSNFGDFFREKGNVKKNQKGNGPADWPEEHSALNSI